MKKKYIKNAIQVNVLPGPWTSFHGNAIGGKTATWTLEAGTETEDPDMNWVERL